MNTTDDRIFVSGLTEKLLDRSQIPLVWSIDRAEVIEGVYYLVDGALELRAEHFDMLGWPPGEPETYAPLLLECFDQGGWFYGLFAGDELVGVAVLENRWIGSRRDTLQFKFLQIGRAYRGLGLGRRLFELACAEARRRGAKRLYISATPTENTIRFYMGLGCILASEVDPDLFALEPEDIHLEYQITER